MWKCALLSLLCLGACTPTAANVTPETPPVLTSGLASYYGKKENGRLTSSGAIFDSSRMTAAHRTLPFGTNLTVTNLRNGNSCEVEITDRGPARWTGRVIDVSEGAARCLDMVHSGVVPVELRTADR
jgi:rare lipoprotein A